jgi:aminomethyltransferase
VGSDKILSQIKDKKSVTSKRVGIILTQKGPPPRSHDKLYSGDELVGEITSGVFGPSVGKPVAMGYVKKTCAKVGTELEIEIRGKRRGIQIAKMPFVTPGYKN